MDAQTAFDHLGHCRVMAGMRGPFYPDVALRLAEVLIDEGFNVFEFTLNSPKAIEAMQAVKAQFGDRAVVGMGTVLSVTDARRVLDAGADFVVSPAFQPEVVEVVQLAGVLCAPGVLTPTEAIQAWAMGVPLLKLFPIGALGVEHFQAMFGPLNHMRFMCNGAMNAENGEAFLAAGAFALGMGGWLTGDGTWTETKLRSRAHVMKNAVAAGTGGQPEHRT